MSALPLKADLLPRKGNVSSGPEAAIVVGRYRDDARVMDS